MTMVSNEKPASPSMIMAYQHRRNAYGVMKIAAAAMAIMA